MARSALIQEKVSREVLGAFYTVYNELGFGFLEAVYARALEIELLARGLAVAREVPVDVRYGSDIVGCYRADVVVESAVLVEIKAGRLLDPEAERQLLNYLRGSTIEVGLLLHFGPKPVFRRMIFTNDYAAALKGERSARIRGSASSA